MQNTIKVTVIAVSDNEFCGKPAEPELAVGRTLTATGKEIGSFHLSQAGRLLQGLLFMLAAHIRSTLSLVI